MSFQPPSIPKTAEEQLALMRDGYKASLILKVGKLEVPVRILPAEEEAAVISGAKARVKVPEHAETKLHVSIEIMKSMLEKGATIENQPYLGRRFLDSLSHKELETLYDQYLSICESVNPEFEKLSDERIAEMILAIKKKERTPTDFFTSELAGIGRFFLAQIQAQDSALGSLSQG